MAGRRVAATGLMSSKKAATAASSQQQQERGTKRAAVDEEGEEDGASASTAFSVGDSSPLSASSSLSSSSSSSSYGDEDAARFKRLKSMAQNFSRHLICPITQEIMVDPVIAADGISYERKEITQWLASKNTSPKTNLPLEHKALISNLTLKQQIDELMASGEVDDDLGADYADRKYKTSPEYAQELFDEGKVEEAAELGLPKAQGKMASRCYFGSYGVTKDLDKSVE